MCRNNIAPATRSQATQDVEQVRSDRGFVLSGSGYITRRFALALPMELHPLAELLVSHGRNLPN